MKTSVLFILAGLFIFVPSLFAQTVEGDTITVMGTVSDEVTQQPISGALIRVFSGFGRSERVDSVFTDSQGKYKMVDIIVIKFGLRRITASKSGYVSPFQNISANPPDTITADFSLNLPAQTGDTSVVAGTVTDSSGNPLSSAYVAVFNTIKQGPQTSIDTLGSVLTDNTGKYQITVVTSRNSASVLASEVNHITQTTSVVLDSQVTVDFKLLPTDVPHLIPVPSPISNRRPTLAWHPVSNASVYSIEVDTVGDFKNPLIIAPTNDTAYTLTVDLPLTTIFWRVESDANPKVFSSVNSFLIQSIVVISPRAISFNIFEAYVRPSPTANGFTVTASEIIEWVSIFSLSGTYIYVNSGRGLSSTRMSISPDLPAGVYMIMVNGNMNSKKLVVIK